MLGQAKQEKQQKANRIARDSLSQDASGFWPFLEQVADEICARRLRLPALIALEAGRPLAFVGGQLLWICQPALSLFLSSNMLGNAARLLEDPDAVSALIESLEARV
jgi:hypothetical protein